MRDPDEPVELKQVELGTRSAVRFYRHSEKQRIRNRKAQKAFRERAKKAKELAEDSATAAREVEEAWHRLHAEREAFAAERQVWLSTSRNVTETLGTWVSPSAEGLAVRPADSFKVAILKSPGVPQSLLDVLFSAACQSFVICGLELPARRDVEFWRLDSHLHFRSNLGREAIARAVADAESDSSSRSLDRLKDLMLTWMTFMKLCSMNDRTAGADLTRLMFQWVHSYPYEQYGAPPAYHWHRTAARAQLSAGQRQQMLELQEQFHERLHSIRVRAAALPDHLNAFLEGNMDAVSERMATHSPAAAQDRSTLLSDLLQEEHEAASEFFFGVRGKVLTSIQDARIFLAAFPYQPCMDAICQALTDWDDYPDLSAFEPQPGPQQHIDILGAAPTRTTSLPLLQPALPLPPSQHPPSVDFPGFPALPAYSSAKASAASNNEACSGLPDKRAHPRLDPWTVTIELHQQQVQMSAMGEALPVAPELVPAQAGDLCSLGTADHMGLQPRQAQPLREALFAAAEPVPMPFAELPSAESSALNVGAHSSVGMPQAQAAAVPEALGVGAPESLALQTGAQASTQAAQDPELLQFFTQLSSEP